MKEHVTWLFGIPSDKLYVIPNGVTDPPPIEVDIDFRRKNMR